MNQILQYVKVHNMNKFYVHNYNIKTYLQTILRAMHKDKFVPDVVIGLSRGGLQPAVMLSNYFDVPMIPVSLALRDHQVEKLDFELDPNKKYLVIDDINDSGATLNRLAQYMNEHTWRSAVLINNLPSPFEPDYYGIEINKDEEDVWVVYPWEEWWQSN